MASHAVFPDPKVYLKDIPGVFPEPVIASPPLGHQQTFIILHGRGSTAAKFGPPLLATIASSTNQTIQQAFPHAKLVFLTASKIRAKIYKRAYTHQWFDEWHMEDRVTHWDLPVEGLKKSIPYVADVLRKEIAIIGRENVVLWGLSQGCATSLATLLTWDSEPFGAVIGMCGYLPLANLIEEVSESRSFGSSATVPSSAESEGDDDGVEEGMKRIGEDQDEDLFYPAGEDTSGDPFSPFDGDINSTTGLQSSCDRAEVDLPTEAIIRFREGLDMEQHLAMSFQKIPIFLGHGDMDEKVSLDLGLQANKCLEFVGANVQMATYAGLGHWFSEDMICDIFLYLHRKLTPKTI